MEQLTINPAASYQRIEDHSELEQGDTVHLKGHLGTNMTVVATASKDGNQNEHPGGSAYLVWLDSEQKIQRTWLPVACLLKQV